MHDASVRRDHQNIPRDQQLRRDRFSLIGDVAAPAVKILRGLPQNRAHVRTVHRRFKFPLILTRLPDGHTYAENRHRDDGGGVIVIVVEKPQDEAPYLKDVERIEHLQEEKRRDRQLFHSYLVRAVHQSPVETNKNQSNG